MSIKKAFLYLTLSIFVGCQDQPPTTLFTALSPKTTGVNFKNTLRESEEFNVLNYGYFYNGGGVAVGDINNDGLPDIYLTGNMKASHLYLNKGNWEFEEIAVKAGVDAAGLWNTGVTMADVNNDGWLDIYVCRSAANLAIRRENLLFINNRNLTFAEMSTEFGLNDSGYSTQATFFDYDKDGDLDMYLLNHSVQEFAGFSRLLKNYKNRSNPDYGDKLYQNNLIPAEKESFGRFADVSHRAGIKNNVLGFGLGVAVDDLNNDGWPDIYVSNDYNEEDYCYINQQDGSFKESVREHFDHTSLFSMGSDVADINNDGLPEVYTLDMLPEDNYRQKMTSGADNFDKKQALYDAGFHYQSMRNMLHLNNGNGTFSEIGQLAGISNTDWSWAALFADFDNDGWKDLFVSNGYKSDYTNMDFMAYAANQQVRSQQTGQATAVSDLLSKIPAIEVPNYIYKNNQDLTFSNKTEEWGLNQPSLSHGAAYADFDADGDLDLIVNNVNDVVTLYRNNSNLFNQHNYLKVTLRNSPLNRLGYGAKVTIKVRDKMQSQTLMPTRGFQSSVEPVLHFGLGKDSQIDKIEILWPNGQLQLVENVKANQSITIEYEVTEAPIDQKALAQENQIFQNNTISSLSPVHVENLFNDFKREPLLPHMLSSQGPRLAVGDVNKDGLEDVFIGGASGQAGRLFVQRKDGNFIETNSKVFEEDLQSEDLEAIFFDANGDAHLDLYVCSGGNEAVKDAPEYQDHLYLNNGKGNFSKSNGLPLIPSSTSCVDAVDLNGDGDLDLFVGGRLVPGDYPLAPQSYILENDGKGNFKDITSQVAPEIANIGMVCDALWTDYNADQLPDLLLVGEWMPITLFENVNGKLTKNPALAIENSAGWWNCVASADIDNDGDPDYIAGNFGFNSQLKASNEKPATIYAKDFDNNGTLDPLISYYIGEKSYPMHPRDDLIGQLVSLKKKFTFYKDYADAEISDILSTEDLADALQLEAQTFATSYIENKGDGTFELKELPLPAQISPVYGILVDDFNRDGNPDLLLGGNFTETRVQFGRYDASKGTALLGDGKGGFQILPNAESGLSIRGSVRDLKKLKTPSGEEMIIVTKNNDKLQLIDLVK